MLKQLSAYASWRYLYSEYKPRQCLLQTENLNGRQQH